MKVEVMENVTEEDINKYNSAKRLSNGSEGVDNVVNIIIKRISEDLRDLKLVKKDGSTKTYPQGYIVGIQGDKMTVEITEDKEHSKETKVRENVIGIWKEIKQSELYTSTTFVTFCYDEDDSIIEHHRLEDGAKIVIEHPEKGKIEETIKNDKTVESLI